MERGGGCRGGRRGEVCFCSRPTDCLRDLRSLFVAVAMAVASGVSRGIGPIAARSLDGRGGRSYYDDDVPRGDEDRRGIYTSFGRIQLGLQASTEPGAELDYWPGLKLEDVVPNSEEERADLPSVDWIGNG